MRDHGRGLQQLESLPDVLQSLRTPPHEMSRVWAHRAFSPGSSLTAHALWRHECEQGSQPLSQWSLSLRQAVSAFLHSVQPLHPIGMNTFNRLLAPQERPHQTAS